MEYILSTDCITKKFGKHYAVDNVSIHIRQGDIYGLIGSNGSGKTTILRMISGLAKPTSGGYSIFGKTDKNKDLVMSRIGVLIEAPGLYPNMSAAENLKLKCITLGIKSKGYVEELLNFVGLSNVGNKHTKKFSVGMKQRLGIALAMVGEPDIIILDEPINGLDPQGIVEVREIIEKLNKEKNITFIISSHILEELSKIATNYGIINNGKLIKEITDKQFVQEYSGYIELKTDDTSKACTVLEKIGISKYKVIDSNTIRIFEQISESGEIAVKLAQQNVKIIEINCRNTTLEDYFLKLTGGVEIA